MGRQHKPAIRLSTVDQARLDRGEIATPEEALGESEGKEVRRRQRTVTPRNAAEAALLAERPPHFGKL
ncbi:hypothetical protein [Neoactinobaculum massilliense]|uniref:hypothetical protein n=1 Tax=Neoactinobaculum massilliense TaxID=2364794 RepID=UPI000F542FFC|nr:hypothetical protein [Neoactinobaculum massilliense]